MFEQKFDTYVCEGDSISCEVGGFTVTALLIYDHDTSAHEYDEDGWCFDTNDPEYGERNKEIIEAFDNGDWGYYLVILSVSVDDLTLDDHAAVLGGVEGNFPNTDNSYLTDVANELLAEIDFEQYRERIKALSEKLEVA